jgi:multiple antibiotic resistance protein
MPNFPAYIKIFTALLAILNPWGVLPFFLSVTTDYTDEERRKIANTIALSVVSVLTVTALAGQEILEFFGISVDAFKVGGSILLMIMAIDMLKGKGKASQEPESPLDKTGIAVVPLSIPLIAGPGSISTVIIYANQSKNWLHLTLIIACIILASLVTWLILRAASRIGSFVGAIGLNVAGRLMGLLLAAIAVEFFVSGISKLLPGLAA